MVVCNLSGNLRLSGVEVEGLDLSEKNFSGRPTPFTTEGMRYLRLRMDNKQRIKYVTVWVYLIQKLYTRNSDGSFVEYAGYLPHGRPIRCKFNETGSDRYTNMALDEELCKLLDEVNFIDTNFDIETSVTYGFGFGNVYSLRGLEVTLSEEDYNRVLSLYSLTGRAE